ncbi:MAG: M20/M25/M40 family metallo-hydrolase [Clostridia bacterium]|nr:M20/M25/M40 family metallo-hydrolase [Clostridia bacterium]
MKDFEIIKKLVSFNTIKDKENVQIMNYIEDYLIGLGFKTEIKTKNLVMSIGENPKLGFLGHTDTVMYTNEFIDPFNVKIKDNKLYGLGVCDMKGGIAAMLDALSEIDFTKLKYGMKLYFTYDEEIGFNGTFDLVNTDERFPEYMIFGEPTYNELFVGSKGLVEYDVKFRGKKAHSSNPSIGIDANMNCVKFIYELNEFYEKEIKSNENNIFEIPYTTMNVGVINGGIEKNSISDNCDITIDFRPVYKEQIQKFKNELNKLAKKYNANIIDIVEIQPFTNEIEFIKDMKTTNFITEASIVDDKVKKIILGVGPITAHEVNENITIDSYNKLIEQYKDLIYEILG